MGQNTVDRFINSTVKYCDLGPFGLDCSVQVINAKFAPKQYISLLKLNEMRLEINANEEG